MTTLTSTSSLGVILTDGGLNDIALPNGSVIGQVDDATIRRQLSGIVRDAHTRPLNEIIAEYSSWLEKHRS